MLRRSVFSLAAAAVSLLAAACTDRSPTLLGDDFFPGGRPTTVQVTLPADSFFRAHGDFAGYPASAGSPNFLIVADDFEGMLDAHALLRFTRPTETPEYTQGGTTRTDSIRAFTAGRLVASIDSAASAAGPGATFRLFELAQTYHAPTVTWELAADTAGAPTQWAEPGGTRGALLAETVYNPAVAGDSISFALDSAAVERITGADFPGLLVTVSSGSRVQTAPFVLRTGVHPATASPDTVLAVNLTGGSQRYIFTPDPPRSAAALEVGGIRSARTLFNLDLSTTVPACAPGGSACGQVPLRDVRLNEVALLFRPVPTPGGFQVLDSIPLILSEIDEPELGGRAPLGGFLQGTLTRFSPGDSLLVVPVTDFVQYAVARDTTIAGDFALVSIPEASTFGVLWLEPTPRLRITYTLPAATRFP